MSSFIILIVQFRLVPEDVHIDFEASVDIVWYMT